MESTRRMNSNYSENWQHLKSILTGYATTNRSSRLYSYTDHTQAKALSIFLAHATLATPKLDRPTVEAILTGRTTWPSTSAAPPFVGGNIPLSFLEENGLVAFYTNWCSIHCLRMGNVDNVDPSLIPLIQTIEHLKDISYGQNGYIQPHYIMPENELDRLLVTHFGNIPRVELLPALLLENGNFKLLPGNQNFSSLVSTYLWLKLCELLEPEQAFEQWILCLRVNCSWAMPVLFDYLNSSDKNIFHDQLISYLNKDAALSLSIDTLWKQCINEHDFSSILTPTRVHVGITIGADESTHSRDEDIIELEKPTLDTLSAAYGSSPCKDDTNNLQFVRQGKHFRHWREPVEFYSALVSNTIENSIYLEGITLQSSGFTDSLLDLAASRPILKHLLLNVLPEYENNTYKIFLLSNIATCDIALFYLSQRSPANSRRENNPFIQDFDKGYQYLVCHEYLRTIEKESDSGQRLFNVVDLLGDRCNNLNTKDFSKNFEYQFLLCLLGSLNHQHVIQLGQAFAQFSATSETTKINQSQQHHRYLLGFWLMEHLEDTGINPTGTLNSLLRTGLLKYYKIEFEENLEGHRRSLEPSAFFSALPWHKLIEQEDVTPLLALSNNCNDWLRRLNYSSENNFVCASTIRHYLQILMCVGRPQRTSNNWDRIANRVAEIVRTLGFGPREQATYLFNETFYAREYDLWTQFCSYTNLLQNSLYDDLVERVTPLIPLDQLFVLLERCSVIARAQRLQNIIATRQNPETEDLGLSELEKAFVSACDTGHKDLAAKLITTAKGFLAQERFAKTSNPHIVRARKVWSSYEYKWQLMDLLATQLPPDKFAEEARRLPIPHDHSNQPYQENDQAHWQECEYFRRYIIAAAYCQKDPEKCVRIMKGLYPETKNNHHNFMLLKGCLSLYAINKDKLGLRQSLSQFLSNLGGIEPEHMPSPWIATILDTYQQLHDAPKADIFWMQLNTDQQDRVEVLHPYCKILIAEGKSLIAQQIVDRYLELNQQASEELGLEELGLNELINELAKIRPHEQSLTQYIQIMFEESQRSTAQLTKHYSQIVSKEFEDYVAIVSHSKSTHEYLKNIVLEITNELLLRKKNLQQHSVTPLGKVNARVTQEDLINDWFTSLFDKRMAEARIGFRDQKRGGQSASGKTPGEIDGYITDAKNKRIAIFEAFRLFSIDKTVIADHLNKISGYDNESLSPIFIVAYCDVSNFAGLIGGYSDFITNQDYKGFSIDLEICHNVEVQRNTDLLWLGMERRYRNHQEVIFYHLLLNMSIK